MRDQKFNMERLKQQRSGTLEEGLQAMLEMWWSTTHQRGTMPVLHGVTLHYSVTIKGKANGKERQGQSR